MNLKKIISAAAAAAIASAAISVGASATLVVVDNVVDPATGLITFSSGTGSWMPVVYSDGTMDSSEKAPVDYGIDCQAIASVEVVITPDDPDWFEGAFGGAIVLSNKSAADASHNWNGKEYWGTIDDTLDTPIETLDDSKPVIFTRTGDLEYTGIMTVDSTNNVVDDYSLVQIAVQEWGSDMSEIKVKSMTIKDASGNVLISYDENGNASLPNLAGSAEAAAEEETVAETEAPAEEEAADEVAEAPAAEEEAPAAEEADTTAADDEDEAADASDDAVEEAAEEAPVDEAPAEEAAEEPAAEIDDTAAPAEEAAPVETESAVDAAPAETAAPAVVSGDTTAATTSSKGSPNTGIADVAAVAGIALVAGGAVVVASKKRK